MPTQPPPPTPRPAGHAGPPGLQLRPPWVVQAMSTGGEWRLAPTSVCSGPCLLAGPSPLGMPAAWWPGRVPRRPFPRPGVAPPPQCVLEKSPGHCRARTPEECTSPLVLGLGSASGAGDLDVQALVLPLWVLHSSGISSHCKQVRPPGWSRLQRPVWGEVWRGGAGSRAAAIC